MLLIITSAFFIMLNDSFFGRENGLSRVDAAILLVLFCIFMAYVLIVAHKNRNEKKYKRKHRAHAQYAIGRSLIYIVITLVVIAISSDVVVDNAVAVAEKIGVSQKIIAMTIIVIGTSLPELVMTVGASRKGEYDLAIGNIIGTNIFNICIVMGLPVALFGTITPESFQVMDLVMLVGSAALLFVSTRRDRKISRFEGGLMLAIFAIYYGFVIYEGLIA